MIIKLKARVVKKLPIVIKLPRQFLAANDVRRGDILETYLNEHRELIIKIKKGV